MPLQSQYSELRQHIARAYFSLLMPSKYMFVSDKIISDMKIKEPCYLDHLMFLGYLFQHATDHSYSIHGKSFFVLISAR